MDINERVAKVEVHIEDLDRRVADVEDTSKLSYEMLNELKIMNVNVNSQLTDVSTQIDKVDTKVNNIETKVDELEQKPQKLSLKAWIYIGCTLGGFIVGKLIDLVFSIM